MKDINDEKELPVNVPKFPSISYELPQVNWIDEDLQEKIMEAIPLHHRPIFSFMMIYGVRPGEARALQHDDINCKDNIITIHRAFSEDTYRDVTKTKRSRELPLFEDVAYMIRQLPRILGCPFVFTMDGHPYLDNRLGAIWRKACKKVGVKTNLYEGTRHSAASQLYNRGVALQMIMELLGHLTIKMTQRYTHITVGSLRAALHGSNRVVKLIRRNDSN